MCVLDAPEKRKRREMIHGVHLQRLLPFILIKSNDFLWHRFQCVCVWFPRNWFKHWNKFCLRTFPLTWNWTIVQCFNYYRLSFELRLVLPFQSYSSKYPIEKVEEERKQKISGIHFLLLDSFFYHSYIHCQANVKCVQCKKFSSTSSSSCSITWNGQVICSFRRIINYSCLDTDSIHLITHSEVVCDSFNVK